MKKKNVLIIIFLVAFAGLFPVNNVFCRLVLETEIITGVVQENLDGVLSIDNNKYYPAPAKKDLINQAASIEPSSTISLRYFVLDDKNIYLELATGNKKLQIRKRPGADNASKGKL